MTERKKEEAQEEVKPEIKGKEPTQNQQVSINQIIDSYPADREKVRDTLLMGIHMELNKIGNLLDWFAKRKQEEIDRTIKLKP